MKGFTENDNGERKKTAVDKANELHKEQGHRDNSLRNTDRRPLGATTFCFVS